MIGWKGFTIGNGGEAKKSSENLEGHWNYLRGENRWKTWVSWSLEGEDGLHFIPVRPTLGLCFSYSGFLLGRRTWHCNHRSGPGMSIGSQWHARRMRSCKLLPDAVDETEILESQQTRCYNDRCIKITEVQEHTSKRWQQDSPRSILNASVWTGREMRRYSDPLNAVW